VVKLDSNGNTQWERQIGCSATGSSGCDAGASFVQQTSDGGYVVTGFGGTYPSYLSTGLVIKLSSTGAVQWQNTYGPMGINPSIQQTRDGGYIVTSGEANTDGFAGWTDLAALKLDSNGNIQWQKQYQDPFTHCVLMGDGCDYVPNRTDGLSVRQTSDGGYIFAGYFGTYAGYNQGWLLRTNSSGNVQWQKSYSFAQEFLTVRQTSDGGFVSAGYGGQVMKVDANGNISSCSAIQNTAATIVSSLITTTALSLPAASLSSSVTVSAAAGPVSVTSTKKC